MSVDQERIIVRELIILLVCLLLFYITALYVEFHLFKKLFSLAVYFYPTYLIFRVLFWAVGILGARLRKSENKINWEALIVRESLTVLGFLVLFYVCVLFMDNRYLRVVYRFALFGFPAYIGVRIVLIIIRIYPFSH